MYVFNWKKKVDKDMALKINQKKIILKTENFNRNRPEIRNPGSKLKAQTSKLRSEENSPSIHTQTQ